MKVKSFPKSPNIYPNLSLKPNFFVTFSIVGVSSIELSKVALDIILKSTVLERIWLLSWYQAEYNPAVKNVEYWIASLDTWICSIILSFFLSKIEIIPDIWLGDK